METTLRDAFCWATEKGIHIYDADGWRGPTGRPLEDAISEAEFDERVGRCTVGLL